MIQDLWWIWMWAITGHGPFMWTISMSPNHADVTAEASLAKLVLQGAGHAKTAVWAAQFGPWFYTGGHPDQHSMNWGIDGSPIQFLSNCATVTFALEVNGAGTFAAMTGKLYVH